MSAGVRAVEHDQKGELFVRREPMLGACCDEKGHALRERRCRALDLQDTAPLENDVHLVLVMRLLTIRLGRDEDIDADLESG